MKGKTGWQGLILEVSAASTQPFILLSRVNKDSILWRDRDLGDKKIFFIHGPMNSLCHLKGFLMFFPINPYHCMLPVDKLTSYCLWLLIFFQLF